MVDELKVVVSDTHPIYQEVWSSSASHRNSSEEQVLFLTPSGGLRLERLDNHEAAAHRQCAHCGKSTERVCTNCGWANYCSMSCVELHQPIHHHYCVADYKTRFPIVTGLNVVPLAEAANAMQKQLSASTTPATSISLPPPTATTAKLTLLEASIIQSRCDTIRRYMAEANGTPVCAICGDSCIATVEKTEDQRHIDRTTSPDGQDCAMKISRRFSGDHGTEQKAYQRLMRFAGMLLCQPCVKIQAAARK